MIIIIIIIGTNESKMIAHSCLYQARSLLVFVACPLRPVVEEDDDGWSRAKRGRPFGSDKLQTKIRIVLVDSAPRRVCSEFNNALRIIVVPLSASLIFGNINEPLSILSLFQ